MHSASKARRKIMERLRQPLLLLLLLHIALFSWFLGTAARAAKPIAKLNCTTHCGKVEIPFPFGIGKGCYIDEWFEINCTKNSNVPVLSRANLKVTGISVDDGTLSVRNPITYWNCTEKDNNRQSPDLSESPFFFSQRNNFAAVSCGVIALMSSGKSTIGGCMSICNDDSVAAANMSCNGMDCCQTTIPSSLRAFNTSFKAIEADREKACKYAFLADKEWFESDTTTFSAIRGMDDVPVVLEWVLYNYSTQKVFGTFINTNEPKDNYSFAEFVWDEESSQYVGYTNSTCQYDSTSLGLQCHCPGGYSGNPYLLSGCRDIDECNSSYPRYLCPSKYECVNYAGYYNCFPPIGKKSRLKVIFIAIGSSLGALLLLAFGVWLFKFVKKRKNIKRKEKFFKQNGGLLLQQQLSSGELNIEKTKLFKSNELEKATDKFNSDRILGQGGQGTVYKGMLADGKIVAVKKSKIVDESKLTEFINEVVILSQINHRNVVKLLGCCLETEVPLLVYEYIPNGTLSQYILDHNEDFPLTWEMRIRIAAEVAGALSYLHSSASLPIFHRDIKSTNILLDEKYRAKVADFGTSKSVSIDQTHLTTIVQGTFGYLDPEYFQSSQFTDKSDVYSFGVVLVELLTGQKPILSARAEETRSLVTYFMRVMEDNRLFDIVDARVMKEGKREAISAFANLAERCLNLNGKRRPTMKEVATVLEDIQRSSKNISNGQQIFEVVDDVRDQVLAERWDVVTTSTWSSLEGGSGTGSSSDALPLLSPKTL